MEGDGETVFRHALGLEGIVSKRTAGTLVFFILSQSGERPER
jgi:hypothetical protein